MDRIAADFESIKLSKWWQWVEQLVSERKERYISNLVNAKNDADIYQLQGRIKELNSIFSILSKTKED